jgi:exodeoxyribonuclease V alpha subunit
MTPRAVAPLAARLMSRRQMLKLKAPSEFNGEVTVRRLRYASPQTGWAVVEAGGADGEPIVLVGQLAHLEARERARVVGSWVQDARYGPQVKVAQVTPLPPTDAEAVVAYLKRVKHVGPARAGRLIARYGPAGTLAAVDADPTAAFAAAGLRGRAAREAAGSWERLRGARRLHLLLDPHGLGYLVGRLRDAYGEAAYRTITERPYELTSVFGVGFRLADRIAQGVGVPRDCPERARAATLHLLAEAERNGSTCLPRRRLTAQLEGLLGAPVEDGLVERLVRSGDLARSGEWIYRRATAELEAGLARRVARLVGSEPSRKLAAAFGPGPGAVRAGRSASPAPDPAGERVKLTAEQLAGVANAFAHRLSLITGGPGTGKTASIRTIATLAARQGLRVLLAAPTGRAAIRITEATGLRAVTVHAALGWIPGEGPTHDEEDPLPCELLIVDETSMANLELLVTLLRAVGPRTHVVLVGDADQLAPVGAGKPFAELVEADGVPSTRLSHIFRQAAGSMIVQGAHSIRRGSAPSFTADEGMRRDLFLVERSDPAAALAEVVSLVSRRLPEHFDIDPLADIQVFAPVYRGALGIDALNAALRDQLNPDGAPVGSGRLRIGDKLMLTGRNLHELGLMNGTVLRLLDEISGEEEDAALVLSSEEATFRLPAAQADGLRLAYACSVHRGQGIELPVAVIVAHPAAGAFFLRREMLYTAITRARLAAVVVGTREVVARAARTADTGARHSRLGERLREETGRCRR